MKHHPASAVAVALVAVLLLGAAPPPKIVAEWNSPQDTDTKFRNFLAIGISDDREVRHRFEDKLVSHLRGKDVSAVTSYSVVPDLLHPGSREEILKKIEELQIDAAISFRVIPLEDRAEADWDAQWRSEASAGGTLKDLVAATLPVKKVKSKKYGVEVTLWIVGSRGRLWTGRSGLHSRQELFKGAGDFIHDVVQTLQYYHRI
jgi:hypothetical protein